jgi:L-lactate dehydrogenase complex protein LldG
MTARNRILQRLAGVDFPDLPPAPDVAAYYARHRRAEDGAARLARFRAAIEAAHAEVHDTDAAGWPLKLLEICTAKGIASLLAGTTADTAQLAAAAVPAELRLVRYDRPVDAWRGELFADIDAGLTRARSAIAETGSLVLWPGPDEPRLMSLVPPVHFVLLDAAAIHADLHAAMTEERWADGLPSNVVVVSGPSKTADIQQTLAYGAHGPRELVVLIVHPQGAGA